MNNPSKRSLCLFMYRLIKFFPVFQNSLFSKLCSFAYCQPCYYFHIAPCMSIVQTVVNMLLFKYKYCMQTFEISLGGWVPSSHWTKGQQNLYKIKIFSKYTFCEDKLTRYSLYRWESNLFWTPRARIFPRSSLLGAGQVGFWEFGRGGSTG